ncbi:DUF4377 domain-containing protein [Chryseobacterium potabilaquae]|uniref:DUF4377 domain-containing protein n=1 Tax=Chryseobacterium potabilaquae TaxID=2675057 RepID=A0A6N4X2M9_9FLAO|nr:DUF4377 domain-containing protein [Chryseobacterium potabilaquae]CAA7194622.1 hypothetical protein CHRY9293_00910 [Chryseobacterium potabilaquae]
MKIFTVVSLSLIALTFLSCNTNDNDDLSNLTSKNTPSKSGMTSKVKMVDWQDGEEKVIIVGPNKQSCVGAYPMECLQIKENQEDNWTNFYDGINGFDYEPGYEYVIKVRPEADPYRPSDSGFFIYTLVEVISKTEI